MSDSLPRIPRTQRVLERLTAIKLHANLVRRRFGREPRRESAVIASHLTAIDQEVDVAAALVRELAEHDPGDGADGA
jgi:uncharacterized protein YutE (UPF0331/DUF86 family)